jgi:sialate O-acetylesterase
MFGTVLLTAAMLSAPSTCHVSNVFGDHMVLQRAPEKAMVWGFASAGTTVKTTFGGASLSSVAAADGVWRATLPATKATTVGQNISFSCSTGETFALADVLFGDVSNANIRVPQTFI